MIKADIDLTENLDFKRDISERDKDINKYALVPWKKNNAELKANYRHFSINYNNNGSVLSSNNIIYNIHIPSSYYTASYTTSTSNSSLYWYNITDNNDYQFTMNIVNNDTELSSTSITSNNKLTISYSHNEEKKEYLPSRKENTIISDHNIFKNRGIKIDPIFPYDNQYIDNNYIYEESIPWNNYDIEASNYYIINGSRNRRNNRWSNLNRHESSRIAPWLELLSAREYNDYIEFILENDEDKLMSYIDNLGWFHRHNNNGNSFINVNDDEDIIIA